MKNIHAVLSLVAAVTAFTATTLAGSALAATPSAVPATCAASLTFNHTRDSASFSLNDGSVAPLGLAERLDDARRIVRQVASRVGCVVEELGLTEGVGGNDACVELMPGNAASVSCYVEAADGYFFVTRDLLENATVVFNRWD